MTTTYVQDGRDARQTYLYFGALTFLLYLATPSGYLVDISTSYMLKNHLHASAAQVSVFRLLTAVPTYFAFIFGFLRDTWNPLGLRDRGYFLIFAPLTAVVFLWMALSPISYPALFGGMFLVMLASRLIGAAYSGLMALTGQEKLMSGRLTVLWQIVAYIPVLAGAAASGYLTEHVSASTIFLCLAVLTVGIGAMGLWKPRAVFAGAYDAPQARGTSIVGDLKRLVKHKAIYPAALLMFLFSFAPGGQTPLQYYLTNHLHASDAIYGDFQAIFVASFIPVFLIYGWLCKRVRLGKLLVWGIIISIPQMIPLAFIHTPTEALILAAPIGAMGGIVTGAMWDLAMRSCPPGLQGTLMMLIEAAFALSTRGSDLLGSVIYASSPTYGFTYCVIAITIVYALMLPVVMLIPKHLLATTDGQASPEAEAEVLREIAETPATA
ncbi:MAG: MFS transporter [Caulobacteraceae bacterium]|nr:MFS transporter [Caulobacteraceae bacterium]